MGKRTSKPVLEKKQPEHFPSNKKSSPSRRFESESAISPIKIKLTVKDIDRAGMDGLLDVYKCVVRYAKWLEDNGKASKDESLETAIYQILLMSAEGDINTGANVALCFLKYIHDKKNFDVRKYLDKF